MTQLTPFDRRGSSEREVRRADGSEVRALGLDLALGYKHGCQDVQDVAPRGADRRADSPSGSRSIPDL